MTTPHAPSAPESPYRGIHPFRYRDRDLFFGREQPVSALLVKVLLSRLTVLFGESGAGKSSVLNAGLVPALEREGMKAERLLLQPDGPIVVERMDGDEGSYLPSIFAEGVDATSPSSRARIPLDLERFCAIVRARSKDTYPVLMFDQFEQLFTLFDGDRREVQAGILAALFRIINDETLRAKVVVTIREDFLAKLDVLAKEYPRVFDNRVHLEALDAKSARDAIECPFEKGHRFASRLTEDLAKTLVEDLAKESSGERIHPTHLQIVCSRLWNEYAPGKASIGKDEYVELEGVAGIIGGYLESELGALDAVNRRHAERLLGGLITDSETRDVVSEGKLRDVLVAPGKMSDEALTRTLDYLQQRRLVNTTPKRDTIYYELASEYLIPPVRRELQKLRLEEERQEFERKQKEEAERRLTQARLRQRTVLIVLSILLFASLTLAAMGWVGEKKASVRERKALNERTSALTQSLELERRANSAERELREAAVNAERERSRAENARASAARDAEREREKAVQDARRQEESRALTTGQIDNLRAMAAGKEPPKSQVEAVLDSVANYLWAKRDTEGLRRVLEGAADLVPREYGVDPTALSNLRPVPNGTTWPLKLHYSPMSEVNAGLLLYHWQSMAATLATQWGVLVPLRLELVEDGSLPTHEFVLVRESSKAKQKKARFRVQSERNQVVVLAPDTDGEKRRLDGFLRTYGQGTVDLASTKIVKTYHLVPAWTQPVWKVAGHASFNREGLIALSAAARMLEDPELAITPESVRLILKRVAATRPKTVEEALAARGGLAGLTGDLREIVRQDVGLAHVDYLLDVLSNFPDVPSGEAVARALEMVREWPPNGFPRRLAGRRSRSSPSFASELESSDPLQSAYDEAGVWLPPIEPAIRVSVGGAALRVVRSDGKLAPELMEALVDLRREMNQRFGFIPPGVIFRTDSQLEGGDFRVEILNQTRRDEATRVVSSAPDRTLPALLAELESRYVDARGWWLDTEEANRLLATTPNGLRKWLLDHYTLTDLKLLLQGQVALTVHESGTRAVRAASRGSASIRDEGSIQDLSWLLGSLAFWTQTGGDTADIESTVRWLRRMQRARRDAPTRPSASGTPTGLVQVGIDKLVAGDVEGASAQFKLAVRAGGDEATEAFRSLYANLVRPEARLARIEEACKLPRAGKVMEASAPGVSTRYDLEGLLTSSEVVLAQDRRRSLELCHLWACAGGKHGTAGRTTASHLLSTRVDTWKPEEKYLLAALMLRLHGKSTAEPRKLAEIERLLSESMRALSPPDAEAAFTELLAMYAELPLWHKRLLLSLSQAHPGSFSIQYALGRQLASGESIEDAQASLRLLGNARRNVVSQKPDDQSRWRAWISYLEALAWQTSLMYGDPSSYPRVQEAAAAVETRDREGWPSRDTVELVLVNAHLLADRLPTAVEASESWLRRAPSSLAARSNAAFVRLANLDIGGARRLAQGEDPEEKIDDDIAFKRATLELLSGEGDYERSAKYLLEQTSHPNRDYIRLMLYWRLSKQDRRHEARKLLEERWRSIDRGSWEERLDQGDVEVWRETLVGYFLGEIRREQVLGPVADPSAFRESPLGAAGMTFEDMRGEAYFYDALLQEVSGDPSTRRDRRRRSLEEAAKLPRLVLYEYHMARYLLNAERTN